MRKGNLFFLILFVSIFAFSLYALEKQGTPLVKKEKPLLSSEKGVGGCCKDDGSPLPLALATTPAKKPVKLLVKGKKNVPSTEEETASPKAANKKPQPAGSQPAGSQPGKVPSSDVKLEKESEKKGVSSDEEEDEGEEEFEEYDDDEPGAEEDEDADFSGY